MAICMASKKKYKVMVLIEFGGEKHWCRVRRPGMGDFTFSSKESAEGVVQDYLKAHAATLGSSDIKIEKI